MKLKLLTKDELELTVKEPMTQLPPDAKPPFDFWPYFADIPKEHFAGISCAEANVVSVYNNADKSYLHILIECDEENIFMVLILDLKINEVHGHVLLNTSTGEVFGFGSTT